VAEFCKTRLWLIKYRGDLTQQQVANKAAISRSYYSELESGNKNPGVETAKKLSGVLRFDWTIFFNIRS